MDRQTMSTDIISDVSKQLSPEQVEYVKKAIIECEKKIEFYENKKNSIPELEEKISYFKEKLEGFKRSFILDEDGVCIENIMRLEDQKVKYHVELTVKLYKKIEEKDKEIEWLKSNMDSFLQRLSKNIKQN